MTAAAGRLWHSFAGHAARRAVIDYVKVTALIMLILLITAWTLDLARSFGQVRAAAEAEDAPLLALLLPYLGYRAVDIVTRLLPMACFFGVFIAEILRRLRLETVILSAAGVSPLRRIAPVLLFGALLGGAITVLEAPLRPAAVFAQVELGLGDYASRYRRGLTRAPVWFLDEDLAVRGYLRRSDQPGIENALIFTGFRDPALKTIYAVREAVPTDERFVWELRGVTRWDASAGRAEAEEIERTTLRIAFLPEELEYSGVGEFAVPTAVLERLAGAAVPDASVLVALWQRATAWLLPGAFALLAAALVPLGFSGRVPAIPRLLALAFFGYVSVVSVKVLWSLGELGALAPPTAVLGSVGMAVAVAAGLIWRQS